MSLSQALSTAINGLHTTQAGLSLVASNVANAETPGYTRKTVSQVATASTQDSISVRVAAIQRELDLYVQRQLRTETSGAAYATQRAYFYDRLQTVFGVPGSESSLEFAFNEFTSAVQTLANSPEDISARGAVVSSAKLLAQQLNDMTSRVQNLRRDAELAIADAVNSANEALRQIAALNQRIAGAPSGDNTMATLLDQRDAYVAQLAQLMDINVIKADANQLNIFTNSGVQLVGVEASQLHFDARANIDASTVWDADATRRAVGTLTLSSPYGSSIDLIETKAIRSGEIAAYLQMRDIDLVQTQSQLDAIAMALAQSLSDETIAGTAVTAGPQDGFEIDIGGLLAGNTLTVDYTRSIDGIPRRITFVRVDDPSVLPLPDSASLDPNDRVVGIDFTSGMGYVLTQINAALGLTGITASNPSGTTLRLLDDGAGNVVALNSVSATRTASSFTGSVGLPFFTDGGNLFTNAITSSGVQSAGFAGRISLNLALSADPAKLVLYQSGTPAGDTTRPSFIYDQLVSSTRLFLPSSGIGTGSAPFNGSINAFLRQVVSVQGDAANTARSLKQGQDVVLSALQQRLEDDSGVNIDREMSNLLVLQNAYAANARVMSAVKDMFEMLINM